MFHSSPLQLDLGTCLNMLDELYGAIKVNLFSCLGMRQRCFAVKCFVDEET